MHSSQLTIIISLVMLIYLDGVVYGQDPTLVAHYSFSGNATDNSIYQNDASVNGASSVAGREGELNTAYQFDGIDDSMFAFDDESLRLGEEYTFIIEVMFHSDQSCSILAKNSSQNSFPHFPAYGIDAGGGMINYKGNTDISVTYVRNSTSFPQSIYKLNTWYRYICRRQGTVYYLTTQEIGNGPTITFTKTFSGTTNYDTGPLLIGYSSWNYFHGILDDIKIYDRFLTLDEAIGLDINNPILCEDDPDCFSYIVTMENDAVEVQSGTVDNQIQFNRIDVTNYIITLIDSNGNSIFGYDDPEMEFLNLNNLPSGPHTLRLEHYYKPELTLEFQVKN